jgi:SAM-dependent methyltransferase
MSKRLNVGCGRDIKDGWVNLDRHSLPGVDVVHNIEDLPLPFADEEFDYVYCKDVLEHCDYIPVLRDLHRILKSGGRIFIKVPHFTARNSFVDPTHRRCFSYKTFNFFLKDNSWGRDYYFDFHFERISHNRIIFQKSPALPFNYLLEPLINSVVSLKDFYEITGLSRLFPAYDLEVELVK